jgi:hypothetical protein
MIRITQVKDGSKFMLRVDGWLAGEEGAELLRVIADADEEVALDLSEMRSADRRGIEALRLLRDQGIELLRVPPVIAVLLDTNPPFHSATKSPG